MLSVFLTPLTAQETPVKISDFNYGTTGTDNFIGIDAANGKLYGIFGNLYGDQVNGLISEIDLTSGTPTPFVDPDLTGRNKNFLAPGISNVFSAGGQTFVILNSTASEKTLYAVTDGEPIALLSGPNRTFSKFVSFKDSLFFLSGNLPLSQAANSTDQFLSELWRTDGTPEGTRMVARLLSFQSVFGTELVAGENSIMIEIEDGSGAVFYIYDGLAGELGLLGEGFGQFFTDRNISSSNFFNNTIGYHNGAFYIAGIESGMSTAQIFRVDESSYEITRLDLPNPIFEQYLIDAPDNEINFITVGDELLFTGANAEFSPLSGPNIYRIDGENGTEFTPLYVPQQISNPQYESIFPGTVYRDTLYQLIRAGNNQTAVFRYAPGDNEAQLYALADTLNTNDGTSPVSLEVTDSHLYISDPNDGRFLRIERNNLDTFDQVRIPPPPLRAAKDDPMLEVIGDNAYFLNLSADSLDGFGLYRWNVAAATPELITPSSGTDAPAIFDLDTSTQRLLVDLGESFFYDAPTETRSEVDGSGIPGFAFFGGRVVNDRFIFRGADQNDFNRRPFLLEEDGALFIPPVTTNLPISSDTSYSVLYSTRVGPDTLINRIAVVNGGVVEYYAASATVDDGAVIITGIDGLEINSGTRAQTSGPDGVCFRTIITGTDSAAYQAISTGGEFLGQVVLPTSAPVVRAITPSGLYFEVVDDFLQNLFFFVPYGESATMENIALDRAVPAANNRFSYYTIGERLLFTVDSDSLGREWYAADPDTELATALLDINPGNSSGVIETTATQIGEQLFFAANDGTSGNELWRTDGTPEGTYLVEDINPGPLSSNPSEITLVGETIFFTANGPSGYELYRMSPGDLTPELIIDLNPEGDGLPYDFHADSENFYFLGRDGAGETFEIFQIAAELVPTDAEPTAVAARVFPNPAGNLPVNVVAPAGESLARMQVYSQQGQLLREITVSTERGNIDLSGLPAGTYWLRSWYASGRFSINAVQKVK